MFDNLLREDFTFLKNKKYLLHVIVCVCVCAKDEVKRPEEPPEISQGPRP